MQRCLFYDWMNSDDSSLKKDLECLRSVTRHWQTEHWGLYRLQQQNLLFREVKSAKPLSLWIMRIYGLF